MTGTLASDRHSFQQLVLGSVLDKKANSFNGRVKTEFWVFISSVIKQLKTFIRIIFIILFDMKTD